MFNKRGLSAIITTLLVVLLVLVAIGIVWGVIRNILQKGAEDVASSTSCLNLDVRATSVNCNNPESCIVKLTRSGAESSLLGGVKLVFYSSTENSGVIDKEDVPALGGNVESLVGKTVTVDSTLDNPIKLEVTAYFLDDSGKEQLCTTTSIDIGTGTVSTGGDTGGESGETGGDEGFCGDGTCLEGIENCENCLSDCGCNIGESCVGGICVASCGDGDCVGDETCSTCEADCGSCESEIYCGDESCNGEETCQSCEADCGCEVGSECVEGICEAMEFATSGTIDAVWPPGSGIYFDDVDLPQVDGLYYGAAVYFPDVDATSCYLIVGYSYDPLVYANAIVELSLNEPLGISGGDTYQIWESVTDCNSAYGLG